MIEGEVEEEVKEEVVKKMVKLCEHPKYSKYFNMLKKGVPLPGVRHAMMRDKMDASVLDRDPNEEVELEEGVKEEEVKEEVVKKVKLCEHPKYSKYFNMLKKGVPLPGVRHAMMRDGIDASVLDKDPNEEVELEEEKSEVKKVKLCEHPKYAKYFNMLKKGLPETSVRHAMMRDGVDSSILDKDPNEEVELEEEAKSEGTKSEVKKVKLCEHPKYSKYFNMLKKGLPETSVRHAMMRDGIDSSVLDKDPNEEVELEEEKSEVKKDEVKKVKLCEHPKYSKYFNMLKKGLPETAVRHAMMRDKVDASILDKDPNEEVELEEEKKDEVKKVKLCEHPKYAKYFNMLKKGLPETAVRHAMMRDKVDASVLDKDPNEEVELEEEKKDEVKKVKLCEHPKYAKYFNMLKKGLPETSVRHAMMRDGIDSSVLDKDPNEEVELEEEKKSEVKKVKLCEHPKYSKYFNMLKKGLPEMSVRHAMMRDGVDASILDKDPNEEVELEEEKKDEVKKVKLCDHPKYSKYFNMLKKGLPDTAVRHAMMRDKVDSSVLDRDPNEEVELEEEKKEEVVKKVKLCEHPKYSKYFNMLKKGLPDTSVRHAMMRDKVDVSILDRDPNEEVELEEEKKDEVKKQTEEEDLSEFKPERIMRKVPLYQHPDYEQYFTLLDRHVPRVEVEYNMRKANKDVKVLDMDRNTLFEIEVSATLLLLCLGHFGSPLAASRLRQVLFHAEGRSAEEGCGEEDEGRWRESCCTCACCRLNGRSWATIGIVDGMWTRRVGLRRGREEQFGRSCTGTW